MKKVFKVWVCVFIPWTIYRIFFRFPEWIDEFLVKPIIFILIPLSLIGVKMLPGFEKKRKVFEDIMIGIGIGFVFGLSALLANKAKYGTFLISSTLPLYGTGILLYLALSLATSTSEEILGRGFFFNILKKHTGVFLSAVISSLFSLSLHFPIIFTQLNLTGVTLATFLSSVFLLSMVNSYLYQNRGSLVLPILIHMFWNMSVALYI